MSRNVPSTSHPYWLEAYYGPGGRKGPKKSPNLGRVGEREGDLCIAVQYSTPHSRQMEIDILEAREDIGAINIGSNPYQGE